MTNRHFFVLACMFAAFATTPFACAPQVVDAVDPEADTGGSNATGGGGGEGDTGGSTSGGGSGTGGSGGTGTTCPDGGSTADSDGDLTPDCMDGCPNDPLKIRPVTCGCGLPDSVDDGGVTCQDLQPLLEHRYTFDGTGTVLVDSKGGADGVVVNTQLTGQGTVVLEGAQLNQHIDLPNRILSVLPSATLEAWLQWNGGGAWQRIFDFGDQDSAGVNGRSYLFLTPRTPDRDSGDPSYLGPYLRAVYGRPNTSGGIIEMRANADLNGPRTFPSGRRAHVAVAVDGEAGTMHVYIDGVLEGQYLPETTPPIDLTVVNDVNCWLGRSNYTGDLELDATYHEFRIYNAALTAEEIALSYQAGPDPVFFP